jgi:hypothetical protein
MGRLRRQGRIANTQLDGDSHLRAGLVSIVCFARFFKRGTPPSCLKN